MGTGVRDSRHNRNKKHGVGHQLPTGFQVQPDPRHRTVLAKRAEEARKQTVDQAKPLPEHTKPAKQSKHTHSDVTTPSPSPAASPRKSKKNGSGA